MSRKKKSNHKRTRITKRFLDAWWNNLGLDALFHLMYIPNYEDANDFIDKCDEYWEGLTTVQKREIYYNSI